MKTLLYLSIYMLFVSVAKSQSVEVIVTNIPNNKGKIVVSLYENESTFLKKSLQEKSAIIKDGKAKVVFNPVKNEEYAIALYHDENNNGKLDTYIIGIPKEKVAASNNAAGKNGPPKYQEAKFIVNNINIIQNIKLP